MRRRKGWLDQLIEWIGSGQSIALHSIFFGFMLALPPLAILSWSMTLLILTTAVSLEAIYLAIFIQRAVNKAQAELEVVEDELEDIHTQIVHDPNPWRQMPAETDKSIQM